MKISKIKMTKNNDEGSRVKAVVTLTFDNCLTIRNIRIIQAPNDLFIAMPARKNKEGNFLDICHPINYEFKEYVTREILNLYNSENSEYVFEGEFTKPNIGISVEPVNGNDIVLANLKLIFDDSFCIHGVKALRVRDNENKIIFVFPSIKTVDGKIVSICEMVRYFDEYQSEFLNAFNKEMLNSENYKESSENIKESSEIKSSDPKDEFIDKLKAIKSEKEQYLIIKDLEFDIDKAEMSIEQNGEKFTLFLEVRTNRKKICGEIWSPYLYINNGIPVSTNNIDELVNMNFAYDYKKDNSQTWIMYIFEHQDIMKGKIEILSREGDMLTIKWSGEADIFFNSDYAKNVPFECKFKVNLI